MIIGTISTILALRNKIEDFSIIVFGVMTLFEITIELALIGTLLGI